MSHIACEKQGQFTKQKKDHEDELEQLRTQLAAAEARLSQQSSITHDQLAAEQHKVDELTAVVSSLRSQIAASIAEGAVLNAELSQVRDARDGLAGELSMWKLKVSQTTLAAAEESAKLSAEITEQKMLRQEDMAKLKQLQRKLDEQLDELMSTRSALELAKSAASGLTNSRPELNMVVSVCSFGVTSDVKPTFAAVPCDIPSLPQSLPSVRARSFAAGAQMFGGDVVIAVNGSSTGDPGVGDDDENDDSDKAKPPALLAHCGVALHRARTNPKGFFKSATGLAISYFVLVHVLLLWYIRHC
jgi:hypothetical protein